MTEELDPELVPLQTEEKLAELSVLQGSVEEAKKKAAEYYDQLLRLAAEFDNYRRRADKEKADARQWGKQDVLMPLLGLVDVFEQALSQAEQAKDVKQVTEGLQFLHKNFAGFLKAEGLAPIEIVGKAFDPNLAEAVEQEEVEEDQVGQVVAEIQKGYQFQGRLLRPSRVRVGVAKKT